MEACQIQVVQRTVNFTMSDGKMQYLYGPTSEITMISDLPLLFANGLPTCLQTLSIGQLERFIPYLTQCSGVPEGKKPKWWLDDVDFSTILSKPKCVSSEKWLSDLRTLVSSCYSYHGCEFALRQCVHHNACRSSRTDVYESQTSTKRLIDPKIAIAKASPERSIRVENVPSKSDKTPFQILLCTSCDSEFTTLNEMKLHEQRCSKERLSTNTPELREIAPGRPTLGHKPRHRVSPAHHSVFASLLAYQKISSKALTPRSPNRAIAPLHQSHGQTHFPISKALAPSFDKRLNPSDCDKNSNKFRKCSVRLTRLSKLPPSTIRLVPNKRDHNGEPKRIPDGDVSVRSEDQEEKVPRPLSDLQLERDPHRDKSVTPISQEQFLGYLSLSYMLNSTPRSSVCDSKGLLRHPLKFSNLPISSPLGMKIHGKTSLPADFVSNKIEKMERYCSHTPYGAYMPTTQKDKQDAWSVTRNDLKSNATERLYLYPSQRWWRMPLLRKLQRENEERKQILRRICKPMSIKIRKMTDEEIRKYTSCRTAVIQLHKLTQEEIRSFMKRNDATPPHVSLGVPKADQVVCCIVPTVQRLSLEEIAKYVNPSQR